MGDKEKIMIKRYRITINDTVYRVSVESMKGGWEEDEPRALPPAPGSRPAKPAAERITQERPGAPVTRPEAPVPKPVAASGPAGPAESGTTEIIAPLPGNMWKVKTLDGQAVKRGDVLFIIEAMKMENEIFAPCDGTVSSVSVSEGAAVNTGDLLCIIR